MGASYDVRDACDRVAALEGLRVPPLPGLMIVDESRPKIAASLLVERARVGPVAVPVMVLSAEPYSSDYASADSYVRKPVEIEDLLVRTAAIVPVPPRQPETVVVVFQRDGTDTWWVATSKRFPSCTGLGGSIDLARRNFRLSLEKAIGKQKADALQLFDDVRLPPKGGSWRSF